MDLGLKKGEGSKMPEQLERETSRRGLGGDLVDRFYTAFFHISDRMVDHTVKAMQLEKACETIFASGEFDAIRISLKEKQKLHAGLAVGLMEARDIINHFLGHDDHMHRLKPTDIKPWVEILPGPDINNLGAQPLLSDEVSKEYWRFANEELGAPLGIPTEEGK
jgi:hypothetical protein